MQKNAIKMLLILLCIEGMQTKAHYHLYINCHEPNVTNCTKTSCILLCEFFTDYVVAAGILL